MFLTENPTFLLVFGRTLDLTTIWKALSTPRHMGMNLSETRYTKKREIFMIKKVKNCDLATPYYRKLIKVFFKHFLLFAISISFRVVLKCGSFACKTPSKTIRDADFKRAVLEWWKKCKKHEKTIFSVFSLIERTFLKGFYRVLLFWFPIFMSFLIHDYVFL